MYIYIYIHTYNGEPGPAPSCPAQPNPGRQGLNLETVQCEPLRQGAGEFRVVVFWFVARVDVTASGLEFSESFDGIKVVCKANYEAALFERMTLSTSAAAPAHDPGNAFPLQA